MLMCMDLPKIEVLSGQYEIPGVEEAKCNSDKASECQDRPHQDDKEEKLYGNGHVFLWRSLI
jgi:hypothetical protein